MAHKGNIYPLAFSRDIALGLTSFRTAMAARYDVTILGTDGTVGNLVSGLSVRLTQLPRLPANLVRWQSDVMTIAGIPTQYFLDVATVDLPQVMRMTLSVQVNSLTTAFRLGFSAQQGSAWQFAGADASQDPILMVLPWFKQGSVGPPVWEAQAVGWH